MTGIAPNRWSVSKEITMKSSLVVKAHPEVRKIIVSTLLTLSQAFHSSQQGVGVQIGIYPNSLLSVSLVRINSHLYLVSCLWLYRLWISTHSLLPHLFKFSWSSEHNSSAGPFCFIGAKYWLYESWGPPNIQSFTFLQESTSFYEWVETIFVLLLLAVHLITLTFT